MISGPSSRISAERRYDVVVIGAGINGTSAARELAISGYKVLLAEGADFANGATSRSSRILHCGLRYFETHHPVRTFLTSPRRFLEAASMAKAAMAARAELRQHHPQRCKPFTMCFPLYRKDDIRGWHLDLGFKLLKLLGPVEPPLDYDRLKTDFKTSVPFAEDLRDQDDLLSIATYREYIIDWPDRLCVDAALDAERIGADIRLFTKATIREQNSSGEWIVTLTERQGQVETVAAPIVLNIAGTWIDSVNQDDGTRPSPPLIRGTKGAHIVVRLPERYQGFGVACLHRGGMPFYCLPLGENAFYFGPTETIYDGDASKVAANDDDIDFLLDEANFLLPGSRLTRSDVEFTWAGVRPLTYDPRLPMGRRTCEIHDLASRGLPGVFAMTAGPVMSHRSAGRELRDAVSRVIEPSGNPPQGPLSVECQQAIFGSGHNLPVEAFGHAVLSEHARDLRGILYTRTSFAWGRHLERQTVEAAARSIADLLGWSAEQVAAEVEDFLQFQEAVFRTGSLGSGSKQIRTKGLRGEQETCNLHTH
jgi:glycerol-3-phosphate dehydrogenase